MVTSFLYQDWYRGCSKGSFFIDGDGIITSHQFKLHLTKDSDVFITIQPTANKKGISFGVLTHIID